MEIESLALRHFPAWNTQVLTDADFDNYCGENNIHIIETNLINAAGEYMQYRGKDIILINKYCDKRFVDWVKWHELAHFLAHSPGEFSFATRRKYDWEANVIAAVALIPIALFEKFTPPEITYFYNYPRRLVEMRLKVYARLKL